MRERSGSAFDGIYLGLLQMAAFVVPRRLRSEWKREWRAELWHVRGGDGSLRADREVIRFCLGAFPDAWCLRRQEQSAGPRVPRLQGSAPQCLILLAGLLIVGYAGSLLLPGVRAEIRATRFPLRPGLVVIHNSDWVDGAAPTVSAEKFRIWQSRRQRFFDGFGFYQMGIAAVSRGPASDAKWRVAHATPAIFALMGLPIRFAGQAQNDLPGIILSEQEWMREFNGDPQMIGAILRVGPTNFRVAGVAPSDAHLLPGSADAWILEPGPATGYGYVIAHLSPLAKSAVSGWRFEITEYSSRVTEGALVGVPVGSESPAPWRFYVFSLFLAILSLPATTSVSMGELNYCSHRPGWGQLMLRWLFLWGKIGFVLPVAYYFALDLAFGLGLRGTEGPEDLLIAGSYLMCLFGMRWAVLDQRHRCPVCLRRVAHPARVGLFSRTFLDWNGTELICMSGHTLLHVPGMPTSWFSTQRWMYLDTSWGFLFVDSGTG